MKPTLLLDETAPLVDFEQWLQSRGYLINLTDAHNRNRYQATLLTGSVRDSTGHPFCAAGETKEEAITALKDRIEGRPYYACTITPFWGRTKWVINGHFPYFNP